MIRCYRLSSARYPSHSGKGAALRGGRWYPKGVEAIYAAATPSLAVVEILVNVTILPRDFVLTEIHIPGRVELEFVAAEDLPRGWKSPSPGRATQEFGRRWVHQLRSAVLDVPSAVVPIERNFVINPLHPDFPRIQFLPPVTFRFDPRLK